MTEPTKQYDDIEAYTAYRGFAQMIGEAVVDRIYSRPGDAPTMVLVTRTPTPDGSDFSVEIIEELEV